MMNQKAKIIKTKAGNKTTGTQIKETKGKPGQYGELNSETTKMAESKNLKPGKNFNNAYS